MIFSFSHFPVALFIILILLLLPGKQTPFVMRDYHVANFTRIFLHRLHLLTYLLHGASFTLVFIKSKNLCIVLTSRMEQINRIPEKCITLCSERAVALHYLRHTDILAITLEIKIHNN